MNDAFTNLHKVSRIMLGIKSIAHHMYLDSKLDDTYTEIIWLDMFMSLVYNFWYSSDVALKTEEAKLSVPT